MLGFFIIFMNSNTTPFKKVASKKSLSRKASNPSLPLADGYASTAFENVECMLDKIFNKARGQAFCVKQDKQDTPESFRKQTIEQPPQLLREDEPLYEDCMTPTSAINSNKIYMAPSYSALRDSENIGTSYVSNAPTSANTALSMNSQKSSCTSGVTAPSIKSHNSLTQTSPVTALSIKSQSDGKGAKRQFPTNSVLKASTPSIGSPEHHFKTKNSLTPSYGNFAKKGETELSSGPNTSECSTASFYNDGSLGKSANEDDLENIGVNEIWSGVPPSSMRVRKIVDSQTHLGADLIPMTEQKCQIFYDEPVKASGLKIADVRGRCSYADSSTHGAKSLSPPSDASILSRSQKRTGVRSREFHSSRSSNVNTCQSLNTTSIVTDSFVPFDRRPQQVNYSAASSSEKYPVQLHPTMKESRSALSPHEENLCIVMSDGKGNRVNISLSMLLKSFKGENGPVTASCITLGSKIIWLKNKVRH